MVFARNQNSYQIQEEYHHGTSTLLSYHIIFIIISLILIILNESIYFSIYLSILSIYQQVIDEGIPFPQVDQLPEDIQPIFKGTLVITYYNQKHHREVSIKAVIGKLKTRVLLSTAERPVEEVGEELATHKPVKSSLIFGRDSKWKAEHIVDGNDRTRWYVHSILLVV